MDTPLYDQVQVIEKKECRHCYQEIDVRADRCPFCQIDQRTTSKATFHVISALAAAIVVGAVGYAIHNLNTLDLVVAERDAALAERDSAVAERDSALRSLQEIVVGLEAQDVPQSGDAAAVIESPEKLKMKMIQASWLLLSSCASSTDPTCQAALAAMERSTSDFSNLQAKRSTTGDLNVSCSEGREVLLNLVGTSGRIAHVFNEIYENTSSCRS